MYILIAENGELSLQDCDNMRAFSIREAVSGAAVSALADIATTAEDNHYWLDANAVVELSGRRHDQSWVGDFWAMLAGAEAYGYSDMTAKRVKAHVDRD